MDNRSLLTRYWFKFKTDKHSDFFISQGCGVTAYNYDDAINLLRSKMFKEIEIPEIIEVLENIDIRRLEQNHVAPNIKDPTLRGIWFPGGFDY